MSYEMHFIGEKIKDTQFTLEKLIFGNKWLLDIKKIICSKFTFSMFCAAAYGQSCLPWKLIINFAVEG